MAFQVHLIFLAVLAFFGLTVLANAGLEETSSANPFEQVRSIERRGVDHVSIPTSYQRMSLFGFRLYANIGPDRAITTVVINSLGLAGPDSMARQIKSTISTDAVQTVAVPRLVVALELAARTTMLSSCAMM